MRPPRPRGESRNPPRRQESRAQTSNYELFNCNKDRVPSSSWNYRGCWHQTCPRLDPHEGIWAGLIPTAQLARAALRYGLSLPRSGSIGQFSQLLQPIGLKAVSQAFSPESVPKPPLLMIGRVVQYTTIET